MECNQGFGESLLYGYIISYTECSHFNSIVESQISSTNYISFNNFNSNYNIHKCSHHPEILCEKIISCIVRGVYSNMIAFYKVIGWWHHKTLFYIHWFLHNHGKYGHWAFLHWCMRMRYNSVLNRPSAKELSNPRQASM